MPYFFGVILFVVGSFIGLKFADFDHSFRWLPLIDHRSILTHSFLVPLLLIWALRKHAAQVGDGRLVLRHGAVVRRRKRRLAGTLKVCAG